MERRNDRNDRNDEANEGSGDVEDVSRATGKFFSVHLIFISFLLTETLLGTYSLLTTTPPGPRPTPPLPRAPAHGVEGTCRRRR